jgi:cytochrome c-type biogenesis protein CcmH
MTKVPVWVRWTTLVVCLAVSLIVGSRVFDSIPPTLSQRAASLEATLKCPSCQDLSVAQSTSASSLAVRGYVLRHLNQGWSDSQIVSGLEARYGNAILLVPPAGGLSTLLWILPIVLIVLIVGSVGAFIIRQRRRASGVSS